MLFKPVFSALLATVYAATAVNAWFRVSCPAPIVRERLDPIIQPGVTPSQHVHTVHGASNFAANSTYDTLRASSCTGCEVTPQDLSNYWFPQLYFQSPSTGLFTAVPNGGLLIYYQNRGDQDVSNGGPGLVAFPPGFKMVSGNPVKRSAQFESYPTDSQLYLQEQATFYSCLRYTDGATGYDGIGFPDTNCEAGFNARVHFPACWDGVNLDSPTHTTHVAFLSELDNGSCPSDHPVGLMKLFFEVTWDVNSFVTSGEWDGTNPAWPFLYATGDPTGFSWHGDFQSGWDQTALQNAIDDCNNPNDETGQGVTEACSYLTVIQDSQAEECTIGAVVNESIGLGSTISKLPGCNPIQAGPGNATIYLDSDCPAGDDSN